MITAQQATAAGRAQASLMVLAGLVLAYLIASLTFKRQAAIDLLWIKDFRYWPNVLFGALVFYLGGWLFGGWAGKLILIQHYNAWGTGALVGILLLLTTAFVASWVAFFQEALPLQGSLTDALGDYIVKPVVWVMAVGWLPALLAGFWFGYRLKTRSI